MATSVTNAFIQQWSDQVKLAFQQKGTKLMDQGLTIRGVVGSTYNFPKVAAITANTKTRDSDITALDPTASTVSVTLADYYAGVYLDKLDEIKTNANLAEAYKNSIVGAIGRKVDDVIITALAAATNTTATVTGGFTLAKIAECLTYLNGSDVEPEDRVIVIGAKQLSEALQIQQLTSADYNALNAIQQGSIGNVFGFNWVMSTRLPIATNNRTCFAFSKKALGIAVGKDITTEVNYVPQKVSTLFNSYVSLGATVIENAGVTKFICVE
ncbi:phage capsid protein [Uliginosibacterium sp. 31-16]|uniref:phage capsid protein n=1 Tax=Uliginosibacterium sp. 31-16 TaxID=3068315 RepID=UPI00273EF78C|nr:phage capsid protein [Uliginosibacterium sp. 31-16]MDP5239925.1 phage capsid protein [Uliginosibacterium sp. 31-16]